MGVSIQFESRTVEGAAIQIMEHDDDVLEYYDQPLAFKLVYPDREGRRHGFLHTADFFVLRHDRAGYEEWKDENSLVKLAERMPHRYVRGEGGRWSCPPTEAHTAKHGLYYALRTTAEIGPIYYRNLVFLGDYLLESVDDQE